MHVLQVCLPLQQTHPPCAWQVVALVGQQNLLVATTAYGFNLDDPVWKWSRHVRLGVYSEKCRRGYRLCMCGKKVLIEYVVTHAVVRAIFNSGT